MICEDVILFLQSVSFQQRPFLYSPPRYCNLSLPAGMAFKELKATSSALDGTYPAKNYVTFDL